jgi:2-polyprenyl-6-methoxyphenol hydroxylase-like FAD-dependent oxidoreductase
MGIQPTSTCIEAGAPKACYEDTATQGPLAEFEGATHWVEHPYANGVVLVGDAAGAIASSFGQGLSLTLRDVRLLCSQLRSSSDWEPALHAYATEQDRDFGTVNRVLGATGR